ncbi:MAG: hypothetical protein AAFY19_00895 [Pseudomonadota bacterium]
MPRFTSHSLALVAAAFLTFVTISAVVTPPAASALAALPVLA